MRGLPSREPQVGVPGFRGAGRGGQVVATVGVVSARGEAGPPPPGFGASPAPGAVGGVGVRQSPSRVSTEKSDFFVIRRERKKKTDSFFLLFLGICLTRNDLDDIMC